MTPGVTLGERLRRARERIGVSHRSISERTKLPAALYARLEAGDCAAWPTGIYFRSHVREYAAHLRLDPEDVVSEACEAFPDKAWPEGRPLPHTAEPAAAEAPRAPAGLRFWRRVFSIE